MAGEKRSRSCLGCGCQVVGILALLVFLAVVWVIAVQAGMLERLGLRKSPTDELLSGAPDRQAAAAVVEELHQAEINTRGMSIQVFPITGTDGKLAVAVVDRSQGFVLGQSGDAGAALERLQDMFAGDTLAELGITRVAIESRDEKGRFVAAVTVKSDDLKAAANGEMDPENFVKAVDGRINPIRLMGRLRELAPELVPRE